jgi:hypothetical protein
VADYKAECIECNRPFQKHRIDKQYCSHACLMRHYRRDKRDKLDLLESLIDRLSGENGLLGLTYSPNGAPDAD